MGDNQSRPHRLPSLGARKAVLAIFLLATFVATALLSVPLSHHLPSPLRIPKPIQQAINPLEPLIPPLLGGDDQPPSGGSQGPLAVDVRGSTLSLAGGPFPPGPPVIPPDVSVKQPIPPPPPLPPMVHRRSASGHHTPRQGHEEKNPVTHGRHRKHGRHHKHRADFRIAWHRGTWLHGDRLTHGPSECNRSSVRTAERRAHPHWQGAPGPRRGSAR
jgi:hypothetical protein